MAFTLFKTPSVRVTRHNERSLNERSLNARSLNARSLHARSLGVSMNGDSFNELDRTGEVVIQSVVVRG